MSTAALLTLTVLVVALLGSGVDGQAVGGQCFQRGHCSGDFNGRLVVCLNQRCVDVTANRIDAFYCKTLSREQFRIVQNGIKPRLPLVDGHFLRASL